jgi:3-oxoacyl-ACP reductase-like protein
MSVFGKIMSAIFGSSPAAAAPAGSGSTSAGSTAAAAATAPAAAPMSQVDVEAVLTKLAAQNKEKLDWRKSIVDLMKLLNLDSSLSARQELAKELHYTGNTSDSASMNVWLHKQVMTKLAENGGKVPADLKA